MTSAEAGSAPNATFRHMLVPLDGSRSAEAVLPVAVALARRGAVRLTLVHVLERAAPTTVHGEPHLADAAAAAAYLAGVRERLAAGGGAVATHVHPNPERDLAGSVVEHAAVELAADLVLLATHGEGGLRSAILGSIAQQVLARGATPVLLVRPESRPAGQPFELRRLVVPLDGTPEHEQALPLAEAVARAWGAAVVLIRVVPTPESLAPERAAVAALLPSATRAALEIEEALADEYLRGLASGLRARGVAATWEVLRGDPAQALPEATRRHDADLVAMASHARAGLDAFWSGSVGARLLERLPAPLLIVRSRRPAPTDEARRTG